MEKEDLQNIATTLYAIYVIVLLVTWLGGGIELSTVPILYRSPISLPSAYFYAFPLVFGTVAILVPKGRKSWIIGLLTILGGIVTAVSATYNSPLGIYAIAAIAIVGGIVEIIIRERD